MGRHAILGSARSSSSRAEFLRVARECGFDIRRLADRLAVSERTVKRFIRDSYDRQAAEWLKEQRLNESLLLLAESRSVKRAAHECGFKQQAHFSREFKKLFQLTPSAYLLLRSQRNDVFFDD